MQCPDLMSTFATRDLVEKVNVGGLCERPMLEGSTPFKTDSKPKLNEVAMYVHSSDDLFEHGFDR